MPHAHDADPGPGLAGISADCPVWLPEPSLGAHWLLIYVPPQFGSYSHRRQMSLNKSHCFSQTRIQVAEGQPGPNTSYTSSNHEGHSEGPNRRAGDRRPEKAEVGAWRWWRTSHRARGWSSDSWDGMWQRMQDKTQTLERIGAQSRKEMSKALSLKLGKTSEPSLDKMRWHSARALLLLAFSVLKAREPQNLRTQRSRLSTHL